MKKFTVALGCLFLIAAVVALAQTEKTAAPPAGAATTSPATAPTSQPTTGPAAASKPAWTIDPALPAKDLAEYNQKMEELKKQFPCVQFKDWKGMKFTFVPMYITSQKYGYARFTGGKGKDGHPTYEEAFGRIGTVTNIIITKDQDTKYDLTLTMDDNGQEYKTTVYEAKDGPSGEELPSVAGDSGRKYTTCDDIVPVIDIERARSLWKGKMFWYKFRGIALSPMDISMEKGGKFTKLKRLSPLKVIGIEAGQPVRFILETESGQKVCLDCSLSRTNRHYRQDEMDTKWELGSVFFLEDPHKLYIWDDKTWKAIEDRQPFIGMTVEQAKLCCMYSPDKIEHIKAGNNINEVWKFRIIKFGFTLTFENGILIKIE